MKPGQEDRVRQMMIHFEVYRDESAFRAHITAAHGRAFDNELSQHIDEPAS